MSTQQIKNLTLHNPIGAMKIPTGGFGDYAVTVESLSTYAVVNYKYNNKTIQQHIETKVDKIEQEDSTATTLEDLVNDFNNLLSKLR